MNPGHHAGELRLEVCNALKNRFNYSSHNCPGVVGSVRPRRRHPFRWATGWKGHDCCRSENSRCGWDRRRRHRRRKPGDGYSVEDRHSHTRERRYVSTGHGCPRDKGGCKQSLEGRLVSWSVVRCQLSVERKGRRVGVIPNYEVPSRLSNCLLPSAYCLLPTALPWSGLPKVKRPKTNFRCWRLRPEPEIVVLRVNEQRVGD